MSSEYTDDPWLLDPDGPRERGALVADLADFATGLLAATDVEHSPRAKLGPYRDPTLQALGDPYRRCVPYKVGVVLQAELGSVRPRREWRLFSTL